MRDLLDSSAYRYTVVAAFALLLGAPGVGGVLGFAPDVEAIEGRAANPRPRVPGSWEELSRLPAEADAFLDDGFGFRSPLLTGHSLVHLAMKMSGSPKYMLGKDGWLFHRSIDQQLAQARGLDVFTDAELESWIRTMEQRQRWLEQRGIAFFLLIAPSKHSIYPEKLPTWANSVGPTRHDQLVERLSETPTPLNVVPIRGALLEAKRKHQIYRTTDDHWNDLGAYVAYQQIARSIARIYPNVRVFSMDELELKTLHRSIGRITRGLNLSGFLREDEPTLVAPRPGNVIESSLLGTGPLWGGDQILLLRTGLEDRPSVLFFRDSFSQPIGRLLSESVHRTILAHHQMGGFQHHLVDRFEPDVVVYQMIERGLRWPLRP
jgi:hypothetical protein